MYMGQKRTLVKYGYLFVFAILIVPLCGWKIDATALNTINHIYIYIYIDHAIKYVQIKLVD